MKNNAYSLRFAFVAFLLTGTSSAYSAEDLSPLPGESAMAAIIQNDPNQGRSIMTHNEVLQFVARRKAEDMATRAYFEHVDPDGFAVNFIAYQAGYHHPYSTAPNANSMESIGVRHQNNISAASAAQMVFDAWMDSPLHKSHVLAENAGYQAQTYFAVGYAYLAKGPFDYASHYFVFVSAPPDENATFGSYAEWLFDNLTLIQMNDPEQDSDEDGIPDPFEYALETDPFQSNVFPSPAVDFDTSVGELRFSYPFRDDLDPSLQFSIVSSNDPGLWSLWNPQTIPFTREGNEFILSIGDEPMQFYQLQVQR